jgi:hypothetical protein
LAFSVWESGYLDFIDQISRTQVRLRAGINPYDGGTPLAWRVDDFNAAQWTR